MPRRGIYLIIGIVLLVLGTSILLSLLWKPPVTQFPTNISSPSYLLLSNWNNLSNYVSTGYPIPKPILNRELARPPSILQVFYGKYGLLNINVTITNTGPTESAYLTLNNTVVIREKYGKNNNSVTAELHINSRNTKVEQYHDKHSNLHAE